MGYIPSLYGATKAILGIFALGVASTAMLLYRYQRSLVYPSNFPAGSRTEVLTPDQFGIDDFEVIQLETPDGEKLHAYLLSQRQSSVKEKERGVSDEPNEVMARRPTVLFLHANAGNMGHRLPLAAVFYKRFGCNVFMISYRGYGLSTGEPSEVGIRIDAQTALDHIRKHPILKDTFVIAYGQSIGGAVAIDLASRNPTSIGALILENTFLSIPELIPHVLPPIRPFTFLCREYWPSGVSIKKIGRQIPILFLSGRKDELVPPLHMDTLYARCQSTLKVWKQLEDGTHNDTCVKPGYFEAIGLFLATYIIQHTKGGRVAADAAMKALSGSYAISDHPNGGYEIRSKSSNSSKPVSSSPLARSYDHEGINIETKHTNAPPTSVSRPSSVTSGEWVEMTASDVLPSSENDVAPAVSVAPQDIASSSARKGKL